MYCVVGAYEVLLHWLRGRLEDDHPVVRPNSIGSKYLLPVSAGVTRPHFGRLDSKMRRVVSRGYGIGIFHREPCSSLRGGVRCSDCAVVSILITST